MPLSFENPKRVASFASSKIGDTIMATSLYQMLRRHYPKAHFTLISSLMPHPALEGFDIFDEVIPYSPSLDFEKLNYDPVVLPTFCGEMDQEANFNRYSNTVSLAKLHEKQRKSWRNRLDGTYSDLLFY